MNGQYARETHFALTLLILYAYNFKILRHSVVHVIVAFDTLLK